MIPQTIYYYNKINSRQADNPRRLLAIYSLTIRAGSPTPTKILPLFIRSWTVSEDGHSPFHRQLFKAVQMADSRSRPHVERLLKRHG